MQRPRTVATMHITCSWNKQWTHTHTHAHLEVTVFSIHRIWCPVGITHSSLIASPGRTCMHVTIKKWVYNIHTTGTHKEQWQNEVKPSRPLLSVSWFQSESAKSSTKTHHLLLSSSLPSMPGHGGKTHVVKPHISWLDFISYESWTTAHHYPPWREYFQPHLVKQRTNISLMPCEEAMCNSRETPKDELEHECKYRTLIFRP